MGSAQLALLLGARRFGGSVSAAKTVALDEALHSPDLNSDTGQLRLLWSLFSFVVCLFFMGGSLVAVKTRTWLWLITLTSEHTGSSQRKYTSRGCPHMQAYTEGCIFASNQREEGLFLLKHHRLPLLCCHYNKEEEEVRTALL